MKHNYTARFLCYLKPHVHYVVLKPIHIHARLNSDHHHLINANCMIVFDIPQSNPKKLMKWKTCSNTLNKILFDHGS